MLRIPRFSPATEIRSEKWEAPKFAPGSKTTVCPVETFQKPTNMELGSSTMCQDVVTNQDVTDYYSGSCAPLTSHRESSDEDKDSG
jgi:hypothetical protein